MPLSNNQFSPISESFSAKSKARNRLGNIWLHDIAERFRIRRKAVARDAGIEDSYDVGTYPQESINIHGGGLIKGALLATALLGGGGLGGIFLYDHLINKNKVIEKIPEVVEKVTTNIYDYKVKMKVIPEN